MKKNEFTFNSGNAELKSTILENDSSKIAIILTGDGVKGTKSSSWPPLIDKLINDKVDVFLFDFHGLGYSGGNRSELNLSIGINNLIDAIENLKKRYNTRDKKIIFIASSFGATVFLNTPNILREADLIILKSPACNLYEAYESEHGGFSGMESWLINDISNISGLGIRAYWDALKYNSYANAAYIKCPTLIVHGDSDNTVPISQSKRLAFVVENSELMELEGVDHDYKEKNALIKFIDATTSFIKNKLDE